MQHHIHTQMPCLLEKDRSTLNVLMILIQCQYFHLEHHKVVFPLGDHNLTFFVTVLFQKWIFKQKFPIFFVLSCTESEYDDFILGFYLAVPVPYTSNSTDLVARCTICCRALTEVFFIYSYGLTCS